MKAAHSNARMMPTSAVTDSFLSHLDAAVDMTSPVKPFVPKPFFTSPSKQQSAQKIPSVETKVEKEDVLARGSSDLNLDKLALGTPTKKRDENDDKTEAEEKKPPTTQDDEEMIVKNLKKQSSDTNIVEDMSNADFMPYEELNSDYPHTQLFSNFTFKAKKSRSSNKTEKVTMTPLMKRVSHLAPTSTAVSEALTEAKNEPVTPAKEKKTTPKKSPSPKKATTPKKKVSCENNAAFAFKVSPTTPSKATNGKKTSLSPKSPEVTSPTRTTPPRGSKTKSKEKVSPFFNDIWMQYDRFIKHKRKSDE